MSKSEEQKLAALIKKNMAKAAAKPKSGLRKQYDTTLPPDQSEDDLERRDFFSEMQKREF
jgi:hypothetical protein